MKMDSLLTKDARNLSMPKIEMALYEVLENCILGDSFRYSGDVVKYKKFDGKPPRHLKLIKSAGQSEVVDLTSFCEEREEILKKSLADDDSDEDDDGEAEVVNIKVEPSEFEEDETELLLHGAVAVEIPEVEPAKNPAKVPKKTKAKAKKTTKKTTGMTKKHMGMTKPKNSGDLTSKEINSFIDKK